MKKQKPTDASRQVVLKTYKKKDTQVTKKLPSIFSECFRNKGNTSQQKGTNQRNDRNHYLSHQCAEFVLS